MGSHNTVGPHSLVDLPHLLAHIVSWEDIRDLSSLTSPLGLLIFHSVSDSPSRTLSVSQSHGTEGSPRKGAYGGVIKPKS